MIVSILRGKVPNYKSGEDDDNMIINAPIQTMQHPIIDVNITEYVSAILDSNKVSDFRLKPLFAVVTGMGRGKTRMLVELQKNFNQKENVLSFAITFNGDWGKIIKLPYAFEYYQLTLEYSVNIVTRIISMCYHISLLKTETFVCNALKDLDIDETTPSDLIRECILYIVNQYRLSNPKVDQFVLLVDESLKIQQLLDSTNRHDIHNTLRNSLLSKDMIMDNGDQLKVDLVMSG